jgi:GNAT superfamily N-acetyltransferase
MTDCSIHAEPELSADDREAVIAGLRAYNRSRAQAPGWTPLNLLLRGPDGTIRGGLLGEAGWGWLHIQILWVAEAERGRGYGAELVRRAEREARARGCRGIHLDTHDFQEPGLSHRSAKAFPDEDAGRRPRRNALKNGRSIARSGCR